MVSVWDFFIMENYIDVLGYEGLYQISDLGNVRSISRDVPHANGFGIRFLVGRILKPTLDKKTGYIYISLSAGGKVKKYNIHQLVAIAFLNHVPCGHKEVIDHIDENKLNNYLENLRITTNRINCSKTKRGVTSKYVGVRKNKGKFESQIRIGNTRKYLGRFATEIEAHNAYQNALNEIK